MTSCCRHNSCTTSQLLHSAAELQNSPELLQSVENKSLANASRCSARCTVNTQTQKISLVILYRNNLVPNLVYYKMDNLVAKIQKKHNILTTQKMANSEQTLYKHCEQKAEGCPETHLLSCKMLYSNSFVFSHVIFFIYLSFHILYFHS